MPLPLLPLLPTILSTLAPIVGAGIQRAGSRGDIRRQNEYNAPINQVKRIKEAGLPMSVLDRGAIAGNQSNTPIANDAGLTAAGGHLSNYFQTQTQLKQLDLLKAQIDQTRAEADKTMAERDYLLKGVGETVQPSNLTRGIALQQGYQEAQKRGAELTNQITEVTADNARTKTILENEEAMNRIANLITTRKDTFTNIQGKELDNAIKEIELQYKPQMSEAEFRKLLADTGLVNANKSGKDIDNDIASIRYQVDKATKENQIQGSNIDLALKNLTWESTQAYFDNYQQYQTFVQRVRKEMEGDLIPKDIEGFKNRLKAAFALAYTTVTGISGNSPELTKLIQSIR